MEVKKISREISAPRVILGIVLAIVVLIIAQNLALNLCEIPLILGVPVPVCNILAGILYVVFTYMGVKILCAKFLKISMAEMRIPKFRIKAFWLLAAILMPILVLLISILSGGKWQSNTFDTETVLATITSAAAFYGLAAGIVEEIVFRGVIMGCLEKRFGKVIAVIVPSVLFGALHMIGSSLDLISIVQLLIAGSIVGILFSLVAIESNSIWNNAVIHSIWNMAIVGGILHIGSSADSDSMYNFVLDHKSFLLSGGDFGIEASIISIAIYLLFCIAAIVRLNKAKRSA